MSVLLRRRAGALGDAKGEDRHGGSVPGDRTDGVRESAVGLVVVRVVQVDAVEGVQALGQVVTRQMRQSLGEGHSTEPERCRALSGLTHP
jgi:hypothetical protein